MARYHSSDASPHAMQTSLPACQDAAREEGRSKGGEVLESAASLPPREVPYRAWASPEDPEKFHVDLSK